MEVVNLSEKEGRAADSRYYNEQLGRAALVKGLSFAKGNSPSSK